MNEGLPFSVDRITLGNTVFEGKNNVFLLGADADGQTVMIDTGIGTPAIRDELEAALADRGHSITDVDVVLVTHYHADHAGLAGIVQRASGARVFAHPADKPLVERDDAADDAYEELLDASLETWGTPATSRRELRLFHEQFPDAMGPAPTVEPMTDGDVFAVGDGTLRTVSLAGHTAGLCGFAAAGQDGRYLFSSDALLPHYTPNIGGADLRVSAPLAKYLDTLTLIVDEGFQAAYPGHRERIDDPSARAAAIIDHHRDRTHRVVRTLRDHGPADAWRVSAELFGELDGIHILHGPGEAHAHLDHLERHGIVDETDGEYSLCRSDPAVEPLFPS